MCLSQAEEAEATYRTCIADVTTQHQELEHMKVTVLRQIQEVIKQTDQTIRSVCVPTYSSEQTLAVEIKCLQLQHDTKFNSHHKNNNLTKIKDQLLLLVLEHPSSYHQNLYFSFFFFFQVQ